MNNWQLKTINDVSKKLSLNKLKIKQKQYLPNGLFPVIDQGQDLIGGYYNDESLLISDEPPYIVFGDHTKIKKFIPFKFIPGADGVKVLKPKDNILAKFLYYLLFTIKIEDKGYARHFQLLEKETFLIPDDLETQQAIVSKIEELFSELDKGIEDLKTAQQQLKTYRQSVLKYAFEGKLTNKKVKDGELPKGWEVMNIGKICKCIVPNRDKPKSFNGDIKWVTTPNLKSNSIRLDYENITLGLSQSEVEEYNARVIPIGGVIMTCVGNFGLTAIVEKPIVINQQLHAFISNDLIAPKFIAYNIQYNTYFFEKKSTSTTIQYINKENCNSMPIPLCSVEEQHQIVQEIESRLSVADKMEESITQSLLQAEALRQSILKKAFSGQLL
jgi:type I restriction enzyme S subunit